MSYFPASTGDDLISGVAQGVQTGAAAQQQVQTAPVDPNYVPPSPTTCQAPLIYVPFYDSCVTPCPSGQSYNASGICAASSSSSMLTIVALAVGAVVVLGMTNKRRR